MEDSVLIAGTALMFLFGWVLMKRLDRFLDENQKRIKESSEQQQAEPCVHLVGNISPDELEETLSRFRSSHAHVEIVIYDSEQSLCSSVNVAYSPYHSVPRSSFTAISFFRG